MHRYSAKTATLASTCRLGVGHICTTNQEVTNGWRSRRHDFNSLPLYVLQMPLEIAIGNNSQKPDYDYADGTVFHLFVLEGGALAQAVIPAADGSTQFTLKHTT
ncbi:hypothetical protein [Hafnia paralvei]|uniref:hypothetical protein n=1 Tax=Hafnia paralvei TaxID=546367 RepID=UPI003D680CD8